MYNFLKIPLNYSLIINKIFVVDYLTKKILEEDKIRPLLKLSDIKKYVELNNQTDYSRKNSEENVVLFQDDLKKEPGKADIKEMNGNFSLQDSKYSNRNNEKFKTGQQTNSDKYTLNKNENLTK